jgi:NitT/TauT family transport system substrate-binding protein
MTGTLRAAVLAAVFAALAIAPAQAEPLKIRNAYSSVPGQLVALMPQMPKEVIRNWGKSYVMEPVFIQGSGPMLQALAAKEVDFVNYGYQSFINGVVEAKLDLRAVADVLSDKPPNHATAYWVAKDSGINRIEDLRGKKLGINARGSTNEAALRKMLGDHGLVDGKDYQIVEARFPALLPALKSKRVDLAFLVLPFNRMAQQSGEFKPLFTMREALGPAQTVILGALGEFVDKNRPALTDYFEDELRMRRFLYDPRNRTQALEIASAVAKQPVATFAEWLFTTADNYRDMSGEIDAALLQKNVNDLHRLGITRGTFDVGKYVDLSLVRAAAARLGGS